MSAAPSPAGRTDGKSRPPSEAGAAGGCRQSVSEADGARPNKAGGVPVTPEQIHAAFQFLDVERKGRVTAANLRARLSIFYDKLSPKDARMLMSDEDEISEEFLRALLLANAAADFDPVAEAFKAYDPEETGFISRDMLRYVFERLGYGALGEEDLNILISCADADQDGRVSLSDFRQMMQ